MKKDIVLPGQRFSRLTVVSEDEPYVSPKGQRLRRFVVRCDCGTIKSVVLHVLRIGKSKSCGCLFAAPRPTVEPPAVARARWLPLTKGEWTLVDEDVFEILKHRRLWVNDSRYALMSSKDGSANIRVHRFILGLTDDNTTLVDHINGNKLDNRRSNLRLASPEQNIRNSKPKKGRTYKGVTFQKGKWVAQIAANRKYLYLGRHKTIIEAARAYNEAAKRLFGEFAWLNPIPDEVE